MMNKVMTRIILTITVGLLAACGSPEAGSIENDVTENKTITIEDSVGNSVEVPLNPQLDMPPFQCGALSSQECVARWW